MRMESRAAVGAVILSLAALPGCKERESGAPTNPSPVVVTNGAGTFEIRSRDVNEVASSLRKILAENNGQIITDVIYAGYTNSHWSGNGFVVLIGSNSNAKSQEIITIEGMDAASLATKVSHIRSDSNASVDHIIRTGYENSSWQGNGFVLVISRAEQDNK